jgi:hypothetical protein
MRYIKLICKIFFARKWDYSGSPKWLMKLIASNLNIAWPRSHALFFFFNHHQRRQQQQQQQHDSDEEEEGEEEGNGDNLPIARRCHQQ